MPISKSYNVHITYVAYVQTYCGIFRMFLSLFCAYIMLALSRARI